MATYKVLSFDPTEIRSVIPGSSDILNVPSALVVDGNLTVNGTTTTVNTEIQTSDRFLVMNSNYTSDALQNCGFAFVTDPASTSYSVDNSVTTSTTIVIPTDVTSVLSANDLILVSSAEDAANNGLFEIHSVVFSSPNSTITIKDASTNTPSGSVDGMVLTSLVANADDDTITVTKCKVGILRTDSANGKLQLAFGDDAGGLSFANLLMSTDSITASSVAADDISTGDAAVTIETTSGAVVIDSNASTAKLDGHTGVTIDASNSGDITLDSNAGSVVVTNHNGSSVGLKLGSTLVTSSAAELNLVDGSSAGSIVNSKAVIYGSGGEVNATVLQISGSAITATAAELNIMDGVTATTAEINILDGVTATTAELNIMDGVTATTAEINKLDGVTATTAELNYVDVSSAGTAQGSKAVVLDASKDIAGLHNVSMTSGTSLKPVLTIENTNNDANGASIVLKKNPTDGGTTMAAGDVLGHIAFEAIDDGGNATTFAKIQASATDVSDSAEKGGLDFLAFSNISGSYALGRFADFGISASNTFTFADGALNINIASHDGTNGLALGGTVVTASAAELNIMDGVTSTTAELNILDGVTSTAAELNLVDGSSAGTIINSKAVVYGSGGEVNATTLQIAGSSITSTAAEINLLDGSSAGSVVNSKAAVYGGSGELNATTLQIGGVSITSTAAELNILDGVTSTAAELNILDGVTSTTAEINKLDGVTATTAELNYVDVSTAGTAEASKALVADSNVDISGLRNVEADKLQRSGAALDIEGETGINLKENGITVASIDTDRTFDVDANGLSMSAGSGAAIDLYVGKMLTSGEAIPVGSLVRIHTDGKAYMARSSSVAESKAIGVQMQAAGAADETKKAATMQGSVVDMLFAVNPGGSDAGKDVYLSSTDGKVTLTAPTSGTVMKVGVLLENGNGSTSVLKCELQLQHIVTYA